MRTSKFGENLTFFWDFHKTWRFSWKSHNLKRSLFWLLDDCNNYCKWFLIFHRNKFQRFCIRKCFEDFCKPQFKNLFKLWDSQIWRFSQKSPNLLKMSKKSEIFTKFGDSHNNSLIFSTNYKYLYCRAKKLSPLLLVYISSSTMFIILYFGLCFCLSGHGNVQSNIYYLIMISFLINILIDLKNNEEWYKLLIRKSEGRTGRIQV